MPKAGTETEEGAKEPSEAPVGMGLRVESKTGGRVPAERRLQTQVALLEDGTLLIAQDAENDPYILSYEHEAIAKGFKVRRQIVDLDTIQRIYLGATANDAGRTETIREAKSLMAEAASRGASDIHIRNERGRTQIWMRVNGDLTLMREWTREKGDAICSTLYQAMADVADNTYQPLRRQDARVSNREFLPSDIHGVRIGTTPTVEGNLMVLRLLPEDRTSEEGLAGLGYLAEQAAAIDEAFELPAGIVIFSGPTGSGKSTSLQRGLRGLIRKTGGRKNVLTIEDPVEYPIPGAVQSAISNASSEDARSDAMQSAISGAMRLDPDVIMVSEIRDGASAELAVRAAVTGHLVLTTIHSNSAVDVITRLMNFNIDERILASRSVLALLVFQRLVRVLCHSCCIPIAEAQDRLPPVGTRMRRRIDALAATPNASLFVRGSGCAQCNQTGVTGRTVIAEVIAPDETFLRFVRDKKLAEAEDHWLQSGGLAFPIVAAQKARAGIIDPTSAAEVMGGLEAILQRDLPQSITEDVPRPAASTSIQPIAAPITKPQPVSPRPEAALGKPGNLADAAAAVRALMARKRQSQQPEPGSTP